MSVGPGQAPVRQHASPGVTHAPPMPHENVVPHSSSQEPHTYPPIVVQLSGTHTFDNFSPPTISMRPVFATRIIRVRVVSPASSILKSARDAVELAPMPGLVVSTVVRGRS